MPLWLKAILGVLGGVIILAILIFSLALWMLRIPKLNVKRDDPAAAEKLDAWFTNQHEHGAMPFNGTVLIRRGNEVLLRKAFGLDSEEQALTADSPLRLASVSKQFTAVGILTLVEAGQVDLDAPVSSYLLDCEFNASVRQLLNHTSGIPDVIYRKADSTELLTLEKVENVICDGSVIQEASAFGYSNTGYLLAARIVERVSGHSFEDYMQAAVFDPLEMENSRVWNLVSTRAFPQRAGGFKWKRKRKSKTPLEPTKLDGVAGDGGVFSTINDLENWDRFWSDDRLISKELKTIAMTPETGDYAFGWIREDNSVWHNGSWLGARTYFRRNLKTGDLIILLENSSNMQVTAIGHRVSKFLEK